MTTVKDLLPTEGLLLLDVKGTTGQQLIVKTMEELLIIGAIQLGKEIIDETEVTFIHEKNRSSGYLKDYHRFFIQSIKEHYNAYDEITIKNALTPYKLLGSVRYKLGFKDNRYKFDIYEDLKAGELVKNKFPFYYLDRSLTKKGEAIRLELRILIDNLAEEISTGKDKYRLKELSDYLGPNIILVPGLFKRLGKLEIEKPINFGGLEPEILNPIIEMEIWDRAGLGMDD